MILCVLVIVPTFKVFLFFSLTSCMCNLTKIDIFKMWIPMTVIYNSKSYFRNTFLNLTYRSPYRATYTFLFETSYPRFHLITEMEHLEDADLNLDAFRRKPCYFRWNLVFLTKKLPYPTLNFTLFKIYFPLSSAK